MRFYGWMGRALGAGLVWALIIGMAGAGSPPVSAAELPLRWHFSNPLPHGNNIKGMAYSSTLGLAVQVCEKGRIYTSEDLSWWTPRDSGTTKALRGVAFMNQRILVVGEEGTVLFADDPNHFQAGAIAPTYDWLEGVAVAPVQGVAVAVGDRGSIYRSTNGSNWVRVNVAFTNDLFKVAHSGGRFVAVGAGGLVATSTDGQSWSTNRSLTTSNLYEVGLGDASFLAAGAGGTVLTNQGTFWVPLSGVGATGDLYAMAGLATGPRLLAGDLELRVNSGTGWSSQLLPDYAAGAPAWTYLSALSLNNSMFLVGGRTGMLIEGYRTNNNFAWFESEPSLRPWFWDVAHVGILYAAVGSQAALMTSVDGVNWQLEMPPMSVTNRVLLGVGGSTNLLVAVGEGGAILWSTNSYSALITTNVSSSGVSYTTNWVSNLGMVWELANASTTNTLQGIAEHQGRLVAAGDYGTVLVSDDGIHWAARPTPGYATLSGAAAGPSGFVVCGSGGALWFSATGDQWTALPTGTTNWIYRVRRLGVQWLAVGQNGLLLASTNGLNWTPRNSGVSVWLNDVTRVGDDYFAVGALGTVLYSTNAVDWQVVDSPTGKALYAAATDGRQLVAAGVEGIILRSQVIPLTNSVHITGFGVIKGTNAQQNFFLFSGRTDQRFSLESNDDLNPTNWYTDAVLEIQSLDGSLYYLQTLPQTNTPPARFFRTRLVP